MNTLNGIEQIMGFPPHPSRPSTLKVLLPKPKPHILGTNLLRRLPDLPRRGIRAAEIHADLRPQTAIQPADIAPIQDPIAHRAKQPFEIRSAEIRPAPEFGQRVMGGADAVELDVLDRVHVQALREVGVDAQEFRGRGALGVGGRLGFEAGEERLEPFEGAGVLADPDEFQSPQSRRRVRSAAEVPDVFQDARPGRDTDTGADEDGDFVVEDVFRGGAVGAVDAEAGHLLSVLERDFVHAHWVEGVVVFCLTWASAESVA